MPVLAPHAAPAQAADPARLPRRTAAVGFPGQDMLNPPGRNIAPSDSTGAIGTDRYVELVNQRFGVYDRTGGLASSGALTELAGLPDANLLDPQVIWDPDQNRFFYSMIDTNRDFTSNQLAFGFSKTNLPDIDGWCTYTSAFGAYGADFPDYPRLGDSRDFVLIGIDRFGIGRRHRLGADLAWYQKPPAGPITTCPAASSFATGLFSDLRDVDGHRVGTPVPANQIDSRGTGVVVCTANRTQVSADFITVFSVSREPTSGQAVLGAPRSTAVPLSYAPPPAAPQAGTAYKIETLDGRLTQAVSAVDPSLGAGALASKVAVWTQHTVEASTGGLGSEIRWYEIDAGSATLLQSGIVQSPDLYVYNGAVSPDRQVQGSSSRFGRSMALGFNTSSPTTDIAIQMVSKVGTGPQSPFVMVEQSPGPDVDHTCSDHGEGVCRWGDFAGASPDPVGTPGARVGSVWFTDTYNRASPDDDGIDWLTWNWSAVPAAGPQGLQPAPAGTARI